jgi:hypothetical protein
MDAVGLEILERELAADRKVLADAAGKAEQRIVESNPGHLEACAGRVPSTTNHRADYARTKRF